MVGAVKHKSPRFINNNRSFIIPTNHLPDFGRENENHLYQIQHQEQINGSTIMRYWHCIAWIASVISENIGLINNEERWYEDTSGNILPNEISDSFFIFNKGALYKVIN